jgi:hypothetical protein
MISPVPFRRLSPTHLVLRLVMAASLWHAPIPWLHAHEAHAGTDTGDLALKQHLHRFHRSVEGSPPGWHFHFALPQDLFGDECDEREAPPREPSPCELSAASSAPVKLVESLHRVSERAPEVLPIAVAQDVLPAAVAGEATRNYFATFHDAAAVRALTCVARC